MKTILSTILISVFVFSSVAKDKTKEHPLMKSDTVVWAGLDYSMVRMIGTNDFRILNGVIFPAMLENWNMLFLEERISEAQKNLNRRVIIDISGVTARNKTATKEQIIQIVAAENEIGNSHITFEEITNAVRSYKLESTNGLGLVFIIDKLAEEIVRYGTKRRFITPASGAVSVVFFDVSSREIISVERQIQTVKTGGNFRNFWFGVIKRTDANLDKYSRPNDAPRTRSDEWRRNR